MSHIAKCLALCLCLLFGSASALAQKPSLKGSKSSVARMASQARAHDFTRLRNGSKVEDFVEAGLLVRLKGSRNYNVNWTVSYPYVRPEVKLFVERFTNQSQTKPDKKTAAPCANHTLTVTSSTRPVNEQPSNASSRSVHPMGMAVDFRVPPDRTCRNWLEATLLALEGSRVLEVTREKSPPHYHVAVFPGPYAKYVANKLAAAKKKKK